MNDHDDSFEIDYKKIKLSSKWEERYEFMRPHPSYPIYYEGTIIGYRHDPSDVLHRKEVTAVGNDIYIQEVLDEWLRRIKAAEQAEQEAHQLKIAQQRKENVIKARKALFGE